MTVADKKLIVGFDEVCTQAVAGERCISLGVPPADTLPHHHDTREVPQLIMSNIHNRAAELVVECCSSERICSLNFASRFDGSSKQNSGLD